MRPAGSGWPSVRIASSTASTTTKLAPFRRNAMATPNPEMSSPATAGPTMRDAELEGRLRDLEHQPRLRHALHPRADLRDQLAGPEEPEVAVPESAETCSARRMLACSSGAIWSPGHRS